MLLKQWAQLIYHHMTFYETENIANSLILKQYANSLHKNIVINE